MLFGGSKGIVGLDIGSSSIKVCELKETKKGYFLQNFGIEPLPPEVIVDGQLMNSSAVVDAIQTLMSDRKIKAKDIATSVSGTAVIIKKIKLPAQSPDELAESIKWDAEQYVPFDINDVNLDYQILNPGDEEGQMEVMLVAAKKDFINDYVAVIKEAGLNPLVMDVDSFALENMYEINYPIQEGEVLALVNIGASIININVTKSGAVVFTRDVTVGGNSFTEEIQKQLGVSFEEAETLKIGGSSGADTEEVMRQEVQDVIKSKSQDIASEIQRSLDFFSATSVEDNISKIWLSGGSSKTSGLKELIAERTGIPADHVNPFVNISFNEKMFDMAYLEEVAPRAAVVVGLALRRAGDR